MSAGWHPLTGNEIGELMRFLGPREFSCTSFTERLVRNGHATVPDASVHRVIIRIGSSGSIDGAILQSRTGLLYPVLSDTANHVERTAADLIRRGGRRLYSIMGRTRDVVALETTLARAPREAVDYHLMVQDVPPREAPLPRLPERLVIRMSRPEDATALASLQRRYEEEEVLLAGNRFDANASLHHLEQVLRSQIVVHATLDGIPVAKAGTNARGLFYDQIGGVYTDPSVRSRGLATALMLRLLALVAAEKKSASLFVKLRNAPALKLYRNLGFQVLDGFRISYYR